MTLTKGQVYNLGGGPANTLSIWAEFGPLLSELVGREVEPARFSDWRPGDQPVFVADVRQGAAGVRLGAAGERARGHRPAGRVGAREPRNCLREDPLHPDLLPAPRQRPDDLRRAAGAGAGRPRTPGHGADFAVHGFAAREEIMDGVRVVRVPVAFRFNKGVFMPAFAAVAWREIRAPRRGEHPPAAGRRRVGDLAGPAGRAQARS